MKTSINKKINCRGLVRQFIFDESLFLSYNMWEGMCHEISEALSGSDNHEIEKIDGKFVIWRRGYVYPHFFETDNGNYVCPWWS